jgi:hypothetical protein
MTKLQDNLIYLKIGTFTVATEFISVDVKGSNDVQETTSGVGQAFMQRGAGLGDYSISIELAYEISTVPDVLTQLKQGAVVAVDYGIESNIAGKPRHLQTFILSDNAHTRNVNKQLVKISINGVGADTPTYDMYNGGAF